MNAPVTPKLYELSDEYRVAFAELSDLEGITPEVIEDSLAGLAHDFEIKAEAVYQQIRNLEQQADALAGQAKPFQEEAERLLKRAKSAQADADGLKEYLRIHMERTGLKSIKRPSVTISCVAGRDTVQVEDPDLVPLEYVDLETKIKPKTKELLNALQALEEGQSIPGVRLGKTRSSLRFR